VAKAEKGCIGTINYGLRDEITSKEIDIKRQAWQNDDEKSAAAW
jgi:hypothetical protein